MWWSLGTLAVAVTLWSVFRFALLVVHVVAWAYFHAFTAAFRLIRACVVVVFGRTQAPPPRRLAAPSSASPHELLAGLPRVELPFKAFADGVVLAFEPCSNLCVYNFGAAACLQRALNYEEIRPHLRFTGASSGALVAAVLALDADIMELFLKCLRLLGDLNTRRCGWIGAYSRTIRELVRAAAEVRDAAVPLRKECLRIRTTALGPLPFARDLTDFASQADLELAVLASCYIPVVWEEPIWLKGVGPCLDGGATGFLVDGDFVFGPYHSNLPDVGPEREYPRQLVFQPVDAQDLLRLFEDGYRDCARWVAVGCPSRRTERLDRTSNKESAGKVLAREAWATFLEVAGIRAKPFTT
eukprot:CAMPEP_0117492074 /NCGR_PEP_ID=MMETSP0784-20121206/18395_1 /TAXON_ID=39447 /ORGANISM="" /LENGTH=355 /DNA_ID=CAMNT_0005286885 /DNA_START=70 /DNA_END=1137 /DNA_ORIENTATION=+